jgi:hypothetical protein
MAAIDETHEYAGVLIAPDGFLSEKKCSLSQIKILLSANQIEGYPCSSLSERIRQPLVLFVNEIGHGLPKNCVASLLAGMHWYRPDRPGLFVER